MKLKTIRIIQIIGIIIGLILTCIGAILINYARQELLNGDVPGIFNVMGTLLMYSANINNVLVVLGESFASVIAGMIVILITTISMFLIKDNNQKNLKLEDDFKMQMKN